MSVVEAKLVFTMELPLDLAPTLNVYCGMPPWAKARARREIDLLIHDVLQANAEALGMNVLDYAITGPAVASGRRRKVLVTRHSSSEPDECAVDILGGKLVLDRLVVAGVLAGDSRKHLEREARWKRCKPRQGKLVVEVYDL